jgi:hypothetical protein
MYPQIDQQGTGNAGGQPDQVEQGKLAIFNEASPGYFKVVFEHDFVSLNHYILYYAC